MAYWSLPDEVQLQDFILDWYKRKIILLPAIHQGRILVRSFNGVEYMKKGSLGISEPIGESFEKCNEIDLILVPGVAFDKNGNRLGRGKAYYDNFLKNLPSYKIGICFNFQFVPSVPVDESDIRMNEIVVA